MMRQLLITLAVSTPLAVAVYVLAAWKYRLHELDYNSKSKKHNALIFICTGVCLVVSAVIFYLLFKENISYPFEKRITAYNAYEQLFDAFMKKQLHIDFQPSEGLLAMGNPYDADLRKELEISYLWDRAYFDGKYYSYFGIAPILLVYFPFYLITHALPSAQTVCFILSALSVIAIAALTVAIQTAFLKRVNLVLLLLSIFAVEAGSLIFTVQASADMYYTATQSGILFLALFLLFTVSAYQAESTLGKCLDFALSGVAIAFLAMSRPNMLVYFVIAVPVYLNTLLSKNWGFSQKLLQVMSFAVPTALGAAFVMWYNYARFGSVFDFGANYQLTVHDVSDYAFSAALIMPSMYYYILKLPSFGKYLPFIKLDYVSLYENFNYTRYIYVTSTVGALSFPAISGVALAPSTLVGEKNRTKQGVIFTAILSALFMAYFDTCFAGINIRYLADIMLVLILISTLLLCDFATNVFKSDKAKIIIFTAVSILLALSFAVGMLLILNNEVNYAA